MKKPDAYEELLSKLKTYEDWKHCITVQCGIPLTLDYIEKRLTDLNDPSNYHTQKFVSLWGEPHRQQVIDWFQHAKQEAQS